MHAQPSLPVRLRAQCPPPATPARCSSPTRRHLVRRGGNAVLRRLGPTPRPTTPFTSSPTTLNPDTQPAGLPICSNTPDVCGFPSSVTRLLRPPALPRLNVPGPGDLLSDDGLFALDKLVQAATGRSLSAGNPCRKIPIYSWDDATELSEACGNLPEVQDGSVPYIVGTLSRSIEVAGPTGIEEKEVGVCVAMRPCAPSRSYLFGLSGACGVRVGGEGLCSAACSRSQRVANAPKHCCTLLNPACLPPQPSTPPQAWNLRSRSARALRWRWSPSLWATLSTAAGR